MGGARIDSLKRRLPQPIKRLGWALRRGAGLPSRVVHAAIEYSATALLSPHRQQRIPFLRRRMKFYPGTRLALVTTCGNRWSDLERSLPTFLAQRYAPYEVVVSIYADEEGAAERLRARYAHALRSGSLRVIETEAPTYSQARATNIGVQHAQADYVLAMDADCSLRHPGVIEKMVRYVNLVPFSLLSIGAWGELLVRREEFIALGGFDTSLADTRGGIDMDFIARYVVRYRRPYACLAPAYRVTLVPVGDEVRIRRHHRWHPQWILNHGWNRPRDPLHTAVVAQSAYFTRMGGKHPTKEEDLEATIRYFLRHTPQIPFIVQAPEPAEQRAAGVRIG